MADASNDREMQRVREEVAAWVAVPMAEAALDGAAASASSRDEPVAPEPDGAEGT